MATESGTIGRGAFFLGIVAGVTIAGVGLTFIPSLDIPRWASLGCEMAIVALSLAVTTQIWKRSTVEDAPSLDTDPDARDRKV